MKSLLGLSSFFGSGSCSVSCCFLLLFVTLRLFCSSLRRVSQMGRDGNGEHNDRFHSIHQYETDDLTGAVHNPRSCREWVCAVENGAVAVSEPELKEWEQKVGYVRDIDGNVVRMGSHVNPPR
ncbi:hypothetical protein HKD37_11G031302 [Glycine soja]|nr:hypothetical protein GmHk_11G031894 [Glycine max]